MQSSAILPVGSANDRGERGRYDELRAAWHSPRLHVFLQRTMGVAWVSALPARPVWRCGTHRQEVGVNSIFGGQIVMLAQPLSEIICQVSPFLWIANAASSRGDRQHRSPI
jgi:hypothetical protein